MHLVDMSEMVVQPCPSPGEEPRGFCPAGNGPSHLMQLQLLQTHDPSALAAGSQQQRFTQSQPHPSKYLAACEASGSKTKEPESGFEDVTIQLGSDCRPVGPANTAGAVLNTTGEVSNRGEAVAGRNTFDGAGPGVSNMTGVEPTRADQDSAEPAATLPGGTATEPSKCAPPSKKPLHDGGQKTLDWSAAAVSRKRTADNIMTSKPHARTSVGPVLKQTKLKLATDIT